MTEKTIAFRLRWNDAGCPLKDIPGDAKIVITVSGEGCPPEPTTDVATQEEARPIKEVSIEGNQAGLQALGKIILAVAETDLAGYHEHLDSETYPTFLASDEGWWLTIGLTKAKRRKNPK